MRKSLKKSFDQNNCATNFQIATNGSSFFKKKTKFLSQQDQESYLHYESESNRILNRICNMISPHSNFLKSLISSISLFADFFKKKIINLHSEYTRKQLIMGSITITLIQMKEFQSQNDNKMCTLQWKYLLLILLMKEIISDHSLNLRETMIGLC